MDTFTNTVADAAAYERAFAPDRDDDRPTLADLAEDGADGTCGPIRHSDPIYSSHPYSWECARCEKDGGAGGWQTIEAAQAAFDEHECVEDACPECPTGIVESVGRMERETGHQPYACNASCGFYG